MSTIYKKLSTTFLHILLVVTLTTNILYGQNNNKIWYFGDGNFIDFNPAIPTIQGAGVQIATPTSTYCLEGTSSICDAAGQLMFYSDGRSVWDKNFNLMPNGTGLMGHQSNAQVLIVPNPGNPSIYYIFYADYAAMASTGFRYSEVDMTLNGGLGDVTTTKNILLHAPSAEMVKAVTHCNGSDIWVISHDVSGNKFRAYLVTPSGVNTTAVISSVGAPFTSTTTGMSYMGARKDGKKIAINSAMNVELYDFDNQNGTLCPPISFSNNDFVPGYGIEFSEDGTKLYVSAYSLHQFDISSNNAAVIAASEQAYSITEAGSLMRGPDNKIYVAGGCDYYDASTSTMYTARYIHAIQNPNLYGIGPSNLITNVFTTPRECGLGLPTCYYPTQTTNTCGPTLYADFTTANTTICKGDCINFNNLSTGPAVNYSWTFTGGTPSSYVGLTPPSVCYPNPGTYNVTLLISDCSGNTSTKTITLTVNDCTNPTASFTASQTSICSGDCITFTDNSIGSNINNWTWTFAGATPSTFVGQNPGTVCYNSSGTYTVNLSITDDFGTADYSIVITVNDCMPPLADFMISDNEICSGECIQITDLSIGVSNYMWSVAGGSPSTSVDQNPVFCFNNDGTFTIELNVSNAFGTDVISKTIIVHPKPVIDLGNDITIDQGETVTITATGSSGNYTWLPSDLFTCSNCTTQTFQPQNSEIVTATVVDNNNCMASDEVSIHVNSDDGIFVPNAFTPNNDGINDMFGVQCSFDIDEFKLNIFNRWGELIFESTAKDKLWDGTMNSQFVPSGVYVWTLTGINPGNRQYINTKGHVVVLR